MRQSKARRERYERRRMYEIQLRQWELSKPVWWRFLARYRWKKRKPKLIRRL